MLAESAVGSSEVDFAIQEKVRWVAILVLTAPGGSAGREKGGLVSWSSEEL
jgi:hypothetical protein